MSARAAGQGAADAAVWAQGLARRFDGRAALEDVSFSVRPSEIFGFVGPDGAGKTTLFRILTTLLVPDAGRARVLGLDVVQDLWAVRARVGYMPGRFSLYPDLSVRENLDFAASVFGTTVEAEYGTIEPIYHRLEPFRDRRAGALSGGMKQKLALCCALVHRPELLVLDEPTTGVDAVSRREFWEFLAQLRAAGLTIVVSTPYMDEADRCDRVALIQKGRILEIDAPAAISGTYPLPLFAVAAADRYRLLGALRRFPHVHAAYPFGAEIHYTDARADAAPERITRELHAFLETQGLPDASARPIPAGIEDSFMALMGAPEGERP